MCHNGQMTCPYSCRFVRISCVCEVCVLVCGGTQVPQQRPRRSVDASATSHLQDLQPGTRAVAGESARGRQGGSHGLRRTPARQPGGGKAARLSEDGSPRPPESAGSAAGVGRGGCAAARPWRDAGDRCAAAGTGQGLRGRRRWVAQAAGERWRRNRGGGWGPARPRNPCADAGHGADRRERSGGARPPVMTGATPKFEQCCLIVAPPSGFHLFRSPAHRTTASAVWKSDGSERCACQRANARAKIII